MRSAYLSMETLSDFDVMSLGQKLLMVVSSFEFVFLPC